MLGTGNNTRKPRTTRSTRLIAGLVVAALAAIAMSIAVAAVGDGSGLNLTGDGPLRGFDQSGATLSTYSDGGAIPAGAVLTHGCQVLENLGNETILIKGIDLELADEGVTVVEGPLLWTKAGKEPGLICTAWGLPTDLQDDLQQLPDSFALGPGDQVGVYFGLRYNATVETSVVIGHLVDYEAGGDRYRELFEFQIVFCSDPTADCEPVPPIAENSAAPATISSYYRAAPWS